MSSELPLLGYTQSTVLPTSSSEAEGKLGLVVPLGRCGAVNV